MRVDGRYFGRLLWAPGRPFGGPKKNLKYQEAISGPVLGYMPERSLKWPLGPQGHFCVLECALRNNFSTGPINFQCTGGSPDFFENSTS